ncbi:BZ3500_MvSof-1268-A1-R1_Chr3-1g05700 [Microbotryum saponariae]|uniref:BZ3500_MvSof-1268-A1-R1_Chr3-1g05700 protein n=1 Tax=Microbotryum saponariae TaxID=289078 RepID=A0A2X0LI74_9BASI|nr:BZ3500_MvSof-1268-A1-R1_Chr3-1g05700 [Microbotryum saponariae]SDA04890.1 BZ3501_MvSof-1269-A2-R1_Chr3-1g05370 [Microbotryum saponariae]
MQNLELRELSGLTSKYRAHLIKAGYITAAEVLLAPPTTVAKRTTLPGNEIEALLTELSTVLLSSAAHRSLTVADLVRASPTISYRVPAAALTLAPWPMTTTTGDFGIDKLLDGGIAIGSVTEIAGKASSGKTHLCLQVALSAQLPVSRGGAAGGTIFISSEGMVPSSRLLSLARSICTDMDVKKDDSEDLFTPWDLMDNVHTEKAQDVETLEHLLAFVVPAFIERTRRNSELGVIASTSQLDGPGYELPARTKPQKAPLPIKMIIVDSIAAPMRGDMSASSVGLAARAKNCGVIGDWLKRLAHVYDCAVVVVNQATDIITGDRAPLGFLDAPGDRRRYLRDSEMPPPRIPSPSMLRQPSSSPTPGGGVMSFAGKPAHERYGLPLLLYNRCQIPHFSGQSRSLRSTAALGHAWSNIVNTRIMLSKTGRRKRLVDEDDKELASGPEGPEKEVRLMSLVFSPMVPRATIEYVLIEEGVRSIEMPIMRPSNYVPEPLDQEADEWNASPQQTPLPPPTLPPDDSATAQNGLNGEADTEAELLDSAVLALEDIVEDSQFDRAALLLA